jgi:hypothetical protein
MKLCWTAWKVLCFRITSVSAHHNTVYPAPRCAGLGARTLKYSPMGLEARPVVGVVKRVLTTLAQGDELA